MSLVCATKLKFAMVEVIGDYFFDITVKIVDGLTQIERTDNSNHYCDN